MSDELCADESCSYAHQPHSHESVRPVLDPDGKTVHLVAVDPWSRGSRQAALRAAVHKFDGFDVREEWDVRERIVATLDAAGYEELFQLILEAAADRQHIHFADDCPRSKKRVKDVRSAKRQADLSAARLADDRDALAAIVRELATECGPPLHHEWGDCAWCEENYEDLTGKEASAHDPSCTWRKAVEWVAAHPEGAGQ